MGDPNLNGAQENLFGNYIIQRGLTNPSLRDEILAQVANQVRPRSSFCIQWDRNESPNETEPFTVIAHYLFTFSSPPLGVEESEHFEFRAWLAAPVLLSLCLPALSTVGQVPAEVRMFTLRGNDYAIRNNYTIYL